MVKDALFSWTNPDDTTLDLEAVETTVMALLKLVMKQDRESRDLAADMQAATDEVKSSSSSTNYDYPDLVPRTFEQETGKLSFREKLKLFETSSEPAAAASDFDDATDYDKAATKIDDNDSEEFSDGVTNTSGPISETLFLLAILLGTCILLYFFPPGP